MFSMGGLSCTLGLILLSFVLCAYCDRTSLKIYVDVTGFAGCFRRLNGTQQIGCASKQGGNTGVLHYVEDQESLDWLVSSGPHAPYTALITAEMFTRKTVEELKTSEKVSGILVDFSDREQIPDEFSPDKACPNEGYGLYKDSEYGSCSKVTWNKMGNSLMFFDFNVPVMLLKNASEVDSLIKNCYETFNKPGNFTPDGARDYPLCAVQAKDAMFAAKDTPTCIRRSNLKINMNPVKFCDPLGDINLISFSQGMNKSIPLKNNSVILAAARRDSFTMFDQVTAGADSAVSGTVALLGAIHALKAVSDELQDPSSRPIMFSLFNGEAFDYIGSSRMVYDMQKNVFPHDNDDTDVHKINLEHIGHIIEVSQIGHPADDKKLWLHIDPLSADEEVNTMINYLKEFAIYSGLTYESAPNNQPLPPASSQQFLKHKAIPTVVLADHEQEFTNKYYNSRFDLAARINASYPPGMNETDKYNYTTPAARKITKVSTTLAQTLYRLSTGNTNISLDADETLVTNLLYCILFKPDCDLFRAAVDPASAKILAGHEEPYDLYVGVWSPGSPSRLSFVLKSILIYLYGTEVNATEDECNNMAKNNKLYVFSWICGPYYNETLKNGKCIRSSTFYQQALSPAFSIDDYDFTSGEYSSWTESVWGNNAMKVRYFLIPSRSQEMAYLFGGIAFFAVSSALVFFVSRRASLLFTTVTE